MKGFVTMNMNKNQEKKNTQKVEKSQKDSKKDIKKKVIEELNKKYKGYKDYVHSNEALGVYIIRDVVRKINTKGYWIDIVKHDNNTPNDYGEKYSPDLHIVCRLYPRKTTPIYPPKPTTDNEYLLELYQREVDAITWQASHKDIDYWKEKGNTGYKKTAVCYYERYSFKKIENKDKETENKKLKKVTEIIIKKVHTLTDKEFEKVQYFDEL